MTCDLVAMHMANELLSLPVAGVTLAVGAVVVAASARLAGRTATDRLPLMGVMGAFVFAAQMINFSLPGMPGTSGHLGGAVLLAILLRPAAAIVTMTGILAIQCLFFQDGGLLALGCNIINMGVVPAVGGYWLYRLLAGKRGAPWRRYLAAWAACTLGVAAGAALVPLEAAASGVLQINTWDFLAVMVGVHLLIGLIEGAITFAVLAYLGKVRPEVVDLPATGAARLSRGAVAASILATAALLAGVVSWFASTHPDGLEWSYLGRSYNVPQTVHNDSPAVAAVDQLQAAWTPMPDYSARSAAIGQAPPLPAEESADDGAWPSVNGWGSLAGLTGTALTLAVLLVAARLLRRRPVRS
jgi:cobalt/nickel transport system permease protein